MKVIITELEIEERMQGATDSSVFTESEIVFMCKKTKGQWQNLGLAYRVRKLIYPFTEIPIEFLK